MSQADPSVPSLRKEPPPSAKTSTRGRTSCAAADLHPNNKSQAPTRENRVIRMLNTSCEFEDDPCAGNNVMTGPDEIAGLAADVISELQPQGQVPLQSDVGAASVVPDKPETVRTAVRPAEAISPKPDSSEGLHV